MQLLQQDKAAEAAVLFQKPDWRGVSDYRAGDFAQAAKTFESNTQVQSQYNLGNALAKAGNLQDSLLIYDKLLHDRELGGKLRDDTVFNRDLVKKLLEQQQEQQQGDQGDQSGDQSQESESQRGSQSDDQQQSATRSAEEEKQQQSAQGQGNPGQADSNNAEQQKSDLTNLKQMEGSESEKNSENKDEQQQVGSAATELPDEPLSEDQQATEQWLRNIPDDPSGLLRRKLIQSHRSKYPNVGDGGQPW